MVDLVTVGEVQAHLNDPTADETKLAGFIAAANTVVAKRCPAALADPGDVHVDIVVTRGMQTLILPRPMKALASVTAYSSGTPTVYSVADITAAPPAYGYTYNEAAGLLTLSPMPYGSTVRVVYTPGLSADAQETVKLAALELVRFWWQPSQNGVMTDLGPLDRSGGGGTGNVSIAGYLVPNAVAQMLDAACPRDVGIG